MKFVAVLAALAGAGATLLMLVLLLAGAPNSDPSQLADIYRLMALVAAVGLIGFAAAISALVRGRARLAIMLGLAPALFSAGLFVVLLTVSG